MPFPGRSRHGLNEVSHFWQVVTLSEPPEISDYRSGVGRDSLFLETEGLGVAITAATITASTTV
jgi:hypothetical protein